VAILWLDTHDAAQELRRHGVDHAQARERLAVLPASEQAEAIDPLEEAEVPTPAAAMLGELARQQADQHPVEGDGRISSLHHLALLMLPRGAAGRLLRELGVDYEDVVRRIEEEGARRVRSEDWRPEELPVEGWQEFRVTDAQDQAIRRRFHAVDRPLRRRGVRYMFGRNMDDPEWSLVRIHPGASGLDPREVLDRLLGPAS
jgi:Clp amino terminal domain, pathogenicity island component